MNKKKRRKFLAKQAMIPREERISPADRRIWLDPHEGYQGCSELLMRELGHWDRLPQSIQEAIKRADIKHHRAYNPKSHQRFLERMDRLGLNPDGTPKIP